MQQHNTAKGQSVLGGEVRETMKKPQTEQLDDVLHQWFKVKRGEGKAISGHTALKNIKINKLS